MSARYDFTGEQAMEQGATFNRTLALTNPVITTNDDQTTEETEEVYSLVGYTARMQIREAYDDAEAIITFGEAHEEDGVTVDGATGTITLLKSAEDTAALIAGTYYYDLEITHTDSGVVTRLLAGRFQITPEVTKESTP